MARTTVATSAAVCLCLPSALSAETAPFWLSLLAVWSAWGPASRNPRYYERDWHRPHATMHCAAAAGLTTLANVLRAQCEEELCNPLTS